MELVLATREFFENRMQEFGDLYELCFQQKMSLEEIRWRYLDNPQGELLAYFALDNDKIVANYSATPINLTYNGNDIKAALSLNTMTHPGYIGKGLFVKLASLLYYEIKSRGYSLIYGFPNYISNRTFVEKLGWKDIYEVPMMELTLSNIHTGVTNSIQIVEDDEFMFNYEQCIEKKDKVMVKKTAEYLKWKYSQNPTNKYKNFVVIDEKQRVTSRVIFKYYRERINIIDSYFGDMSEAETLLQQVTFHGRQEKKEMLTLWSQMGSAEHLVLEKMGFKNNSPITYFGGSVFEKRYVDYYDYKNWDIQLGDDNVF